ANTLVATNVTKVDSTHYTYAHVVTAGNGTGTVSLSVGTDLAGNVVTSAPTSGATFTVDNTAPDTTISAQPANPTNSSSASFSFTGSDTVTPAGGLTFQCDLDGGGFGVCTSPKVYSSLSEGSHTFQVKATDQAG